MSLSLSISLSLYIYIHVCVYIYIYTYIHTYIDIPQSTQKKREVIPRKDIPQIYTMYNAGVVGVR